MMMPGREYQAQPSRFGFNGKENDNDVKGFGNQVDYGDRVYDPRVGKFSSVDPLTKSFAELTPYQFASNSPIANVDLDGREAYWYKIYFDESTNKWAAKLETIKTNWFLEIMPGYQLVVKIGDNEWINAGGWSKSKLQEKVNEFVADPVASAQKLLEEQAQKDVETEEFRQQWRDVWVQGFTAGALIKNYVPKSTPSTGTNKQSTAANNGNTNAAASNAEAEKKLQVGSYEQMTKANAGTGQSADHIPSFKALVTMEEKRLGYTLSAVELNALKQKSLTLVIKTRLHQTNSLTYGGRNTKGTQIADSNDPLRAIKRNVDAYRQDLLKEGYSNEEIDKAIIELSKPYLQIKTNKTP